MEWLTRDALITWAGVKIDEYERRAEYLSQVLNEDYQFRGNWNFITAQHAAEAMAIKCRFEYGLHVLTQHNDRRALLHEWEREHNNDRTERGRVARVGSDRREEARAACQAG